MARRTTLRDVAQAANVHLSTAARALKNDPRISPQTRDRIKAVAKQISYEVDPVLSALAAYRQKIRKASFRGTFAWITNYSAPDGWHNGASDLYFEGASERAKELGYNLEQFWLRDANMSARRASSILAARGIRGLLLCPQPRPRGHLSFQWQNFAAVTFGYSMTYPKVHRVTTSHFRSIVNVVRELRGLGYRRIGWACPRHMDDRMDHASSAAFKVEIEALPQSQCIPPFNRTPFLEEEFTLWFEKYRPHAIIAMDPCIITWVRALGHRVPEDVGVVVTTLQGEDGLISGVDERSKIVGMTAVDILAGLVQRGEYGIPNDPLLILVEGKWILGKTVHNVLEPVAASTPIRKKWARVARAPG